MKLSIRCFYEWDVCSLNAVHNTIQYIIRTFDSWILNIFNAAELTVHPIIKRRKNGSRNGYSKYFEIHRYSQITFTEITNLKRAWSGETEHTFLPENIEFSIDNLIQFVQRHRIKTNIEISTTPTPELCFLVTPTTTIYVCVGMALI